MRIQDLMRAASVKRWTIVTTSRDESLAEHSFLVIILSKEIGSRAGLTLPLQDHVMRDAILHDLDEILTGDIPTPAKIDKPKYNYQSKITEAAVKAADIMQAWWFISQWGTGRHAHEVSDNCWLRWEKWIRDNEQEFPYIVRAARSIMHELRDSKHEI